MIKESELVLVKVITHH